MPSQARARHGHAARSIAAASFALMLAGCTPGATIAPRPYNPTTPIPAIRGYDPGAIRERLSSVESAEISRACGNISSPWAYRGPVGRHRSMESYGVHHADGAWAQAVASYLLLAPAVDTATKVPSVEAPCDPKEALPIYLLRFHAKERTTFALLRFDIGAVVLFDAEAPLGMIPMGAIADSLWAALADRLDDDPLLRGQRPEPQALGPSAKWTGTYVFVDELPEVLKKVPPRYPLAARFSEIEGVVFIQALVGTDGRVRDAFVISGAPGLRDAALEAIWKWMFKPARAAGKLTAVWVAIPVKFTLR